MTLSNEKRMFVDGYEQFQEKIGQVGKDHRIFVLFTGSKDEQGISWCPDCVQAEKPLEEALQSSFPSNGIFLQCSVGDRPSWKDPQSPFRKDRQLQLKSIPTLIEWGTKKRLVESELFDSKMISLLFEDD